MIQRDIVNNSTISVLGYDIFNDRLNNIDKPEGMIIINTINPHSYCVALEDELFEEALKKSDVLLPDGVGICWASKLLAGVGMKKIAGADIHHFLLNQLNDSSGKVFYMGASQKTLDMINDKVRKEFPNVKLASYSPPYKSSFTEEENGLMQKVINEYKPDVLFVGMTAPKQEKWVYQNKDLLDVKIIVSIGAVFDFYAGTVKRPNQIWINLGLEWLPRFLKEPKRLWRRNLVSTPKFLFQIFKCKLFNN
jgi:N-acetylglucosaminyldiphosphoundecaprenol N-acetyl-beta-D-mannosaminyltransferase